MPVHKEREVILSEERSQSEDLSRPLILKEENLRQNTIALFEELKRDPEARESFIRNPVGQVSANIFQRDVSPQHLSDANRFLFSMLANDKFRQWLDNYPSETNGQKVTREQFSRDFAKALIEYGDQNIFISMLKHASDGFGLPAFSPVAQQLVIGSEQNVVTETRTTGTGLDTPAHISADAPTNVDVHTGSIAFGYGWAVDPAFMRSIVEQVIAHAKDLASAGQLADLSAEL